MEIRNMNTDDIKQVQHVAKTSWNSTYERIIPREIRERFLNSAYNDDRMKQRMERSLMLVADEDDRVTGFANFSPVRDGGKVELYAIYLLPEIQGKGIGTALLNEGILRLDGVKEIYISVERDNAIGKAFYEAKGFKAVQELEEDFEGHILKTIRMVLEV
ncbi:GNAT family N-acetyltransferase [Neobacillus piezotolerans]|uniref:GNAT family N-acetyltransferase n=1 Tax=Neobacillus piezotolerans TaxID=2259171 RepID=A0A3D8GU71_9BACI|nr:GNAT family N-acetyltransferase [Neobacillus piezotolerans]RDU38003.1 GNAT family N-acetyltransferase [Neobacillus piezotolerans]